MKDGIKIALLLALLAALVYSAGWLSVARWRECRRVHPWWYCASAGDHR